MKLVLASGSNVSSDVDYLTKETLDWVKVKVKDAGLASKTLKQSAEFTTTIKVGNRPVHIIGWHGTGKWGDTSMIHELVSGNFRLSLDDYLPKPYYNMVTYKGSKSIIESEFLKGYKKFIEVFEKAFPNTIK